VIGGPSRRRQKKKGEILSQFLQFLFSGITVGATYALAALGFTLIYNASNVINFAQGEFIMLGGMLAFFFMQAGVPMPLAILLAITIPAVVGLLLEKLAIEPAHDADVVTLIIITIGASLVIRGLIQVWLGKGAHTYPAFSGNEPFLIGGATLLPQSLWVLGITALVVVPFGISLAARWPARPSSPPLQSAGGATGGRQYAMGAADQLRASAALGAIGGVLLTPITLTSYDVGIGSGSRASSRCGRRTGQRPGAVVGGCW
jgi:branched-chain amino acid transport system permease protein